MQFTRTIEGKTWKVVSALACVCGECGASVAVHCLEDKRVVFVEHLDDGKGGFTWRIHNEVGRTSTKENEHLKSFCSEVLDAAQPPAPSEVIASELMQALLGEVLSQLPHPPARNVLPPQKHKVDSVN